MTHSVLPQLRAMLRNEEESIHMHVSALSPICYEMSPKTALPNGSISGTGLMSHTMQVVEQWG
jgi:hypothetical protein